MQIELVLILLMVSSSLVIDIIYLVTTGFKYMEKIEFENNIIKIVIGFTLIIIGYLYLTLNEEKFFTILPTFLVLFVIYYQTQTAKKSSKEQSELMEQQINSSKKLMQQQIDSAKKSMNQQMQSSRESMLYQINHINETRKEDQMLISINSIVKRIDIQKNEVLPFPNILVESLIKKDDLRQWNQNFDTKTLFTESHDRTTMVWPWREITYYLELLLEKKLKPIEHLEGDIIIKCSDITINLKKLIALCNRMYSSNPDFIQIITMILNPYNKLINTFFKSKFIEKDIYDSFYILLSIPNETINIENQLKEHFVSELNALEYIDKEIKINEIQSFGQRVYDEGNKKIIEYEIKINDKIYHRKNGYWTNS